MQDDDDDGRTPDDARPDQVTPGDAAVEDAAVEDAAGEDAAGEAVPGGGPRVASLDALLRDIDGLRRTLETDLSLAAAAIEAGQAQLAVDALAADRRALAAFAEQAQGHLAALDTAAPTLRTAVEQGTRAPVLPLRPRRLRRAAPGLVAAAAALALAFGLGVAADRGTGGATRTQTASTSAALDSYDALAGLVGDQAPPALLRQAADDLHDDVEALVGSADPVTAAQALGLLQAEREALSAAGADPELRGVRERSQQLTDLLSAELPDVAAVLPSGVPTLPPLPPLPTEVPSELPTPPPLPGPEPLPTVPPPPPAPPAAPTPSPALPTR